MSSTYFHWYTEHGFSSIEEKPTLAVLLRTKKGNLFQHNVCELFQIKRWGGGVEHWQKIYWKNMDTDTVFIVCTTTKEH